MDNFINTEKTASEIAIEVCDKLHIVYELKGGKATLRGAPICPDDLAHLFPSASDKFSVGCDHVCD